MTDWYLAANFFSEAAQDPLTRTDSDRRMTLSFSFLPPQGRAALRNFFISNELFARSDPESGLLAGLFRPVSERRGRVPGVRVIPSGGPSAGAAPTAPSA